MSILTRFAVFKSNSNVWAKSFASQADFEQYHALVGCALQGYILFNEAGELLKAGGTAITLEIIRTSITPPLPK